MLCPVAALSNRKGQPGNAQWLLRKWNKGELIKPPSPWWVVLSDLLGAVETLSWFQQGQLLYLLISRIKVWFRAFACVNSRQRYTFCEKPVSLMEDSLFWCTPVTKRTENYLLSECTLDAIFHCPSTVINKSVSAHLQGREMLTWFSWDVYFIGCSSLSQEPYFNIIMREHLSSINTHVHTHTRRSFSGRILVC